MAEQHVTASDRFVCWMKIRGWSNREAARRTGLHPQKVWRIASGRQEPKPSDIEKLCAALGISSPEFYGGAPKAETSEAIG